MKVVFISMGKFLKEKLHIINRFLVNVLLFMVEESTQERQANPIGVDTTDSDSSDDGDLRSFLTVQTRVVAPGSQAAQEEQKEAQT